MTEAPAINAPDSPEDRPDGATSYQPYQPAENQVWRNIFNNMQERRQRDGD